MAQLPQFLNWLVNQPTIINSSMITGVFPAVNVVTDFDADPTGATDSAAAIQSAINSLPVTGGDIVFPSGIYKVASTLTIGNGTSSAVSTRYGVRLIGVGMPVEPVNFSGYPTASNVKILWSGAAGGTILAIKGPLQGWGVQNLLLDGANSANRGLDVISAQYGDVRNLVIVGCMTWGLFSETVAPFGGVTFTGAFHNHYVNLTIAVPSSAVGGGVVLTGVTTANTLFNIFINTTVAILGSTQNGIYLQAAAGNAFYQTHIAGVAGDTSIAFDYNVNNTWPSNNTIDTIEPIVGATFVTNVGSPGVGAKPNYLRNLITTDGATYPILANLSTDRDLVSPPQSVTSSGYTTLPGELIMQWGLATAQNVGTAVTFPISFPNSCFQVSVSCLNGSIQGTTSAGTVTQSGFIAYGPNEGVAYIAIGN